MGRRAEGGWKQCTTCGRHGNKSFTGTIYLSLSLHSLGEKAGSAGYKGVKDACRRVLNWPVLSYCTSSKNTSSDVQVRGVVFTLFENRKLQALLMGDIEIINKIVGGYTSLSDGVFVMGFALPIHFILHE